MSGSEFYVPALNGTAFMGMARCAPPDTPKWGPHDSRWVTEADYDAALARVKELEAQVKDWYKHPAAQAEIGARARKDIELSLIEDILAGEEVSAMMMEYWTDLHDRVVALKREATDTSAALSGARSGEET